MNFYLILIILFIGCAPQTSLVPKKQFSAIMPSTTVSQIDGSTEVHYQCRSDKDEVVVNFKPDEKSSAWWDELGIVGKVIGVVYSIVKLTLN